MRLSRFCVAVAVSLAGALGALAEPVTFAAADGVLVHADYQGGAVGQRPLILLFHMAGSNLHEYDPVAPRLNAAGFDTLAVDQRSGGSAFGHDNATARGAGGDYIAAYADLEAALGWGLAQGAERVIALGSSYSSSLVFVLAAQHPDHVAAVLSFSPGEYFSERDFVRKAAARVTQPVFVSSASDAGEEAAAAEIVAEVAGPSQQFKARRAVHGASSLREDSNPQGEAEIWAAVLAFLDSVR